MRRFILIILFLVCLVSVLFFFYWRLPIKKFDGSREMSPKPSLEAERIINKYSLEAMRSRKYVPSEIKVESKVRETNSVSSYKISYLSDGFLQYALMSVPKSKKPKNGYPVLMFVHGWIFPTDYSTELSYASLAEKFASNGFLVIKPDFRGNGSSEGNVLFDDIPLQYVMAQIEYAIDVRNVLESMANIENADPSKIFLYGHSMGGDVGLRVLELYPQIIAASLWAPSVFWYPESQFYFIHKWYLDYEEYFTNQLKDYVPESEYENVGALENIKYVQTPIIIHHAEQDNVTPYVFGETLAKELEKAGKNVTLYTYEGDNHQLSPHQSQVLRRDLEFFRSFLK